MSKFLLFLVFLSFQQQSYAQNISLLANGNQLIVKSANVISGHLVSATLAADAEIQFGSQNQVYAPEGSRVYFGRTSSQSKNLKVSGLIINSKTEDQTWQLPSGLVLYINCGRTSSGAGFLKFDLEGRLLEGCASSKMQNLLTPQGSKLSVLNQSRLEFFPSGELKSSSLTNGVVTLPGDQEVELAPDSSIRFYDNKKLYYLHLAEGESFVTSTEIANATYFEQPSVESSYPVVFHPNGSLSTAYLGGKNQYSFPMKAYGDLLEIVISHGNVGFDEKGNIDRVASSKDLKINVSETTYVKRTEGSSGLTMFGKLNLGTVVHLDKGKPLFLENKNGQKRLRAHHVVEQGFAFFHELYDYDFREPQSNLITSGL